MNLKYKNHNFSNAPGQFLSDNSAYYICCNCNMITIFNDNIFKYPFKIDNKILTCEEQIIKNIIE